MKKLKSKPTIAELIRTHFNEFKPAERKIANHLLNDYPMAGIVSITELSENGKVSTPTIMRTLNRIGFTSFISFQKALKQELSETLADPISKHGQWAKGAPKEHILNRVADNVVNNLRHTVNHLGYESFNKAVDLLSDTTRTVHLVGGRITHTFADYMCTHLEVIRRDVRMLPLASSRWPHRLIDMQKNDVLVIFDVRRYEADTLRLAESAHAKGVLLVLFTDQWLSPIASYAKYSFPVRIEAPSGWDSGVVTLFLVESLIMAVENKLWRKTSPRIKALEEIFDSTGRFKRHK